jgi:hypothetical protein
VFRVADDGGYRFTRGPDGWDLVTSDDLPVPIEILIGEDLAGRHFVVGLRIGGERGTWGFVDDDGTAVTAEITSQMLRQIRLSEILAAHFEHFEPVRLMEASLAEVSYPLRPRWPDNAALQAFARTYKAELGRRPSRAMTAAAKAHNISRATANRWAQMCRDHGYLPAKGSK